MNTEIEQARAELDRAREAHAAALLAKRDAPTDLDAQRRVQASVQAGKAAWKGYQATATLPLARQIESMVPTDFRDSAE